MYAPMVAVKPSRGVYEQHILKVSPDNLIGYWPLNETRGTLSYDHSKSKLNATMINTPTFFQSGIGDTYPTILFNGTSEYETLPGFESVISGQEGTLICWVQNPTGWVGTWMDAFIASTSTGDRIAVRASLAAGTVLVYRVGGGTSKLVTLAGFSGTGFFCVAISWSFSNDFVKGYVGGVQTLPTLNGIGNYGGIPTVPQIARSSYYWYGKIAHLAVWNTPLTDQEIEWLASVR